MELLVETSKLRSELAAQHDHDIVAIEIKTTQKSAVPHGGGFVLDVHIFFHIKF